MSDRVTNRQAAAVRILTHPTLSVDAKLRDLRLFETITTDSQPARQTGRSVHLQESRPAPGRQLQEAAAILNGDLPLDDKIRLLRELAEDMAPVRSSGRAIHIQEQTPAETAPEVDPAVVEDLIRRVQLLMADVRQGRCGTQGVGTLKDVLAHLESMTGMPAVTTGTKESQAFAARLTGTVSLHEQAKPSQNAKRFLDKVFPRRICR